MNRPLSMMRFVPLVFCLLCAGTARADEIMLNGARIPIRGCVVEDIKSGRVYFRGPRGRLEWRELDEVAAIGFDATPALSRAEQQFTEGDREAGFMSLLRALFTANEEVHELWIRLRLVRYHDARGQFVPATAHAAAIFALRDESAWRLAAPASDPSSVDQATTAQLAEADAHLERANRAVANRELRTIVNRLRRELAPRLAALRPTDRQGAERTASGLTRAAVLGPEAGEAEPTATEPTPEVPVPIAPTGPRPRPGDITPEAIDAWLDAGRTDRALTACRWVAGHPDQRRPGRFLHQFGRALAGRGEPGEAAVMFMRCAIHYPGSALAAASLIETAVIYREHFKRIGPARRLLDRAAALAAANGQTAVRERAETLRAALPVGGDS